MYLKDILMGLSGTMPWLPAAPDRIDLTLATANRLANAGRGRRKSLGEAE
jgi:hypothetical protein